MKALQALISFFARFCIAAVFIFSGASKVVFFDQTAQAMLLKGMTAIPIFLLGAIIIELIGGLSLILGYKTRFGASLLLIFLIPSTLIFHDFWNVTETEFMTQQILFLKNLAIFGGLLNILSIGPGGLAFDSCCCKKKVVEEKTD